tara:strand:+ start:34883 stop:35068 length:186 start_codon:yes stop_codon:yes gene_type:complete
MTDYFTHTKSGRTYELICVANYGVLGDNWPTTAVYKGLADGVIYARPFEEFTVKFEPKEKP